MHRSSPIPLRYIPEVFPTTQQVGRLADLEGYRYWASGSSGISRALANWSRILERHP